jgi:antitoxin (DNA-binding transcriptional repressor) of toxin-antitoxin stability system
MKHLNIREMRSNLGKLDVLVEAEQELIITRNKQASARVLPMQTTKQRPTHADLRALQLENNIASELLIRQDRDERSVYIDTSVLA